MSFESFSRPSVDGDQGDRLLKQPSEAGDVEEGHPGRMQADSLASIYNTLRKRAKQQWQRRPSLEPIYQMYAMRAKKQWQKRPPLKSVYLMYAMIVLAMLLALLLLNRLGIGLRRNPWEPPSEVALWTKPEGFKIIGLVFFGRRATVEILDCYLKKNLVSNGGYLDEVLFISSKATEEDDAWLDQLLLTADEYHKAERRGMSFDNIWGSTVERGPLYIKLDDDLVFLSDDAIPQLVYSKMKHPEALDIAVNLINAAELGWMHYHIGAIHSYLPETEMPSTKGRHDQSYGPSAWRTSALPTWNSTGKEDDSLDVDGPPPYKGHRWLPLRQNDTNLNKTPISKSAYAIFSPNWKSWAIGAQTHYSFLQNLERNELDKFYFADGDGREAIWNMAYGRANINCIAIWGDDIRNNFPFTTADDEEYLSVTLPRKLNRPLLINTYALAVHFSFGPQRELYDTDLLSRYRAYANEMVCTPNNQIRIE